MECKYCGEWIVLAGVGRPPAYCSTRCRVAAHRAAKRIVFPELMTSRKSWVRSDGKRPIAVAGYPASSTNPRSWSSFADVQKSTVGNGFGIMLGGGLGCYDLDHVTDSEARDFIASIPEPIVFTERSMSGRGFHVFIEAPESAGIKSGGIERYTKSRFIRTTGNVFKL